ncbi:flavodoxin domain-containing protein [Actinokineospora auranticolor]|uniref:Menaquinone-dependent protoporphyrinogen oxidase n=1 Tax=Actinokineospora auranticolor TaxID=155976 RepID=A0A2S6H1Y7_9PSEU|nr:flavodoxin domain-containing protein [Actinokineospora auranticolor]PPK71474.1 menaquinone-dependent protoporphyrinogen oxidase [Actinokineospora auranticolor]
MKRVLVLHASKMGATKEIAEAIGAELVGRGLHVTVHDVLEPRALDGYDAVVLGTAIYAGRWRPTARRFFRRFHRELADRRVWLFESGWLGPRPHQVRPTAGGRRRAARIGADSPAVFGGRLDPDKASGFLDRAMAKRMAGDARDWTEIRAWANGVADDLVRDWAEPKAGN